MNRKRNNGFTPPEKAAAPAASYTSFSGDGGIKPPSLVVKKLRSLTGFTLIELLIVVAILAIISPVLYKARSEYAAMQRDLVWQQKAAWSLQSQADLIKAAPFHEIKQTKQSPFDGAAMDSLDIPDAKGAITVENAAQDLKKIILEISWRGADQGRKSMLLTLYRRRS